MQIRAVIMADGAEYAVGAEQGATLAEILGASHPIDLPCGGKGRCLRCRIRAEGALSPPDETERAALSPEELAAGIRLACISRAQGDVVLWPGDAIYENICSGGFAVPFVLDPLYREYGLAVDIGTTTVCARLYGPQGQVSSASMKNPQTAFGADVISRIERSLAGESKALSDSICGALGELAGRLLAEAGIAPQQLDSAVLTGNTTMLYLLTGQNPECLSHAPFIADRLFGEQVQAAPLLAGIPLLETAQALLPRCVSAFVGADITAALLASGMCERAGSAMLVDVGTNGEIALWHGGKLYTSSTAAGPAFEGVGLTCGVYGVRGAVDRLWLENGAVRHSTIGGERPVGICGSGAVDALAVMLACGVIDETGAFEEGDAFPVAEGVFVSAGDVRRIQLAKGAVRAGMETLLCTAGIGWASVDTLFIAGGFGSYLHLPSAAAIGLLPEEMLARTQVIGNASLTGASMLLQNRAFAEQSRRLADAAVTVALDANPVFMEQYVTAMLFE